MRGAALYHENAKRLVQDLHARYIEASPSGAAAPQSAPYWCGCSVPWPPEAARPLVRRVGMVRARVSSSMARDGLLLRKFREPVRAFTKDLHGPRP